MPGAGGVDEVVKARVKHMPAYVYRVWGLGFEVAGFRFRILAFGFRVLGFEFRVSVLGFRVQGSGLGLRV